MRCLKFSRLLLLFALSLFSASIFTTKDVNAYDVMGHLTNWNGTRTYKPIGSSGSFTTASFSGGQSGIIIAPGYMVAGFNIGQNVSIGDDLSIPPVYLTMILSLRYANSGTGTPWWQLNSSSSPSDIPVTCQVIDKRGVSHTYPAHVEFQGGRDDNWRVDYRCRETTSDFRDVSSVRFWVGNQNATQPYIYNANTGGGDLILYDGAYRFVSYEDPAHDTLESIDASVSRIIEQNINIYNMQAEKLDNIEDAVNDLNDSVTDSTITGNFDMPEVPAFGPVATIINSIIDLPRVFLSPGECHDLVGPMPILTDQTFVIPCPKKLLQPFWSAVEIMENFFAAYIWFRTAVYIARQVKKLRDPGNDEEEYLNI